LAVNLSYLPAASIEINIEGRVATKEEMLTLCEQLEMNPQVARVMAQDARQLAMAV
jgi:sirohydrochlorin ferrochelatase